MVTFGVVGADHRHIYHLIEGLLRAGAVCAGYVSASSDPKVVEGVQSRFPQLRAVDTAQELYENPAIDLIVTAAVPCERAGIAIQAMQHGLGSRDDAQAMQFLIPGWKFNNKSPCMVR